MIEFKLDGTIRTANENFLATVGYTLEEIKGQHHRMFCDPEYAASPEYKDFWKKLAEGTPDAGEYKRFGKGGTEVWINASYNPIFNADGKPYKVVKFATNVTEQKLKNADFESQLSAIDKAQAIIEFELDGTILNANQNFLSTVGYSLSEIKGQHHRMFCDTQYTNTAEYRNFWKKLGEGQFDSGKYKRFGKGEREIYIQASYNPIFNADGKPYKVVKYATNITEEVEAYNSLVESFDKASENLMTSAKTLSSTATQLSQNAKSTLEKSNEAAESSDAVTKGVQDVTASTEEMTASIKEITQSSNNASKVASDAKSQSDKASEAIEEMSSASEEVGNIVKTITSIAQQTNLLALNATIEAARAGEAGKGFAVVANEVKELAKQTAVATEDISKKIERIQNITEQAVGAIGEVGTTISKMDEIAATTASAVEEQSATTQNVSKVLVKSNQEVDGISKVIASVNEAAVESDQAAGHTLEAAESLTTLAENLKQLVEDSKKS